MSARGQVATLTPTVQAESDSDDGMPELVEEDEEVSPVACKSGPNSGYLVRRVEFFCRKFSKDNL